MKVLGHHFNGPIVVLGIVEVALAALAQRTCSLLFGQPSGSAPEPLVVSVVMAAGFGVAVSLGMIAVGLYQSNQRLDVSGVVVRVAVAMLIAATMLALVDLVFAVGIEGRVWVVAFAGTLALLTVARLVFLKWLDQGLFQREVLIVGAGARAANVLKLRRRSDRRGFHIAAFVPAEGDTHVLDDEKVSRPQRSLLEFAQGLHVNEIVVAVDDRRRGFPISELLRCKFAGIFVVDLLTFLERETGRVKVDLINPSWLIFSEGFESNARSVLFSRALDLAVALVMLIVTAPLMLFAALAIYFEDGRPIVYSQKRVGLLGRVFTVYKFRSMFTNAEADGKVRWATNADRRVTRVGKLFRKLRIDELPQLFNVLRGDMSLVGPRPERPEFVDTLSATIPYYQERHVVKPGLTGWAQLCYPYGASEADAMEKLQYDLYYIKHKSVIFDLMVLLQTAEVVFWGKGAR